MHSFHRVNPFRKARPVISVRLDVAILVVTLPALVLLFSLISLSSHIHKLSRSMPMISGLSLDPSQSEQLTTSSSSFSSSRNSKASISALTSKSANTSLSLSLSATDAQDDVIRKRLLSDMPQCARNGSRAGSFLLVFQGHSGSTALMTSLRQHSQTHITGFEPVDHGRFVAKSERSSAAALAYTKAFFQNATAHNLTTGFKIRPTHLLRRPTSFAHIVRHFRTRIVWSYRSNILKQAIGDYRIHFYNDRASYEGLKTAPVGASATSTNATAAGSDSISFSSSADDAAIVASYKKRAASIEISNMHALFRLMSNRVRADRSLSMALRAISPDSCLLPVSYESYLRNPSLTLERVQRFLGLSGDEVHPPERAKANQDSLCDLVSNWEDLCRAFFPCVEWRWMLDDYENGCSCSNLPASSFNASKTFCNLNAKVD